MSNSESSKSRDIENINDQNDQQDINEGDTFKNYESFETYVKNYAKNKGFTVRLDTAKYDKKTKEIRWRDIVCSKSGISRKNKLQQTGQAVDNKSTRNRSSQRCNCTFFIRGIKSEDHGLWIVVKINLSHNHDLVPIQLRKFMPDNREIPDNIKDKILGLHKAGINVARIRDIIQYDQPNETYLYNDIHNFIYNNSNGSTKEKLFDAQNFVTLLEQHKIENNEFAYIVKVNNNTNEFESAIWMFPEQKMYYSRFFDIVVFDNTYRTNRFDLPFGIFTGVNNYGQSVCFAGALLKSETTEAMGSAFSVTFNNYETKHRLCQWHLVKNITTNLMSKLGSKWQLFLRNFYGCLYETEEVNFNSAWDSLKVEFPDTVTYLKTLEKHKEKWAVCFNQNIFMAEMSTTQRAESMNNLMKGYINATTSMSTFLNAFESALDSRQQTIEFSQYKERTLNLIYKTPSLFEKQAATILTIYALKKFQEQLLQSSCYKCEEIPPDSEFFIQSNIFNSINQSLQIFLVTRFGSSSNGRVVEYNPNESEMIQIYQSFYKHKPLHDLQDQLIIEQPQLEQDYKYKLNRTIWKLQRFVNQKPETAIIFDETITLLLNAQIAATIENCNGQIINNNDIIKIPQNVKPKGSVRSNKRKKSGIEINSQRKKSKKLKEKDSNENKENIMIGNKGNSSSNDENINSITVSNYNSTFF
ncbi:unnamed protein product [Rhizophagus irregularis]|nr:unnamed protein product [Rhizophagus irregularis]